MNSKYQAEVDEFIDRFGEYRDLRIILYGIGRYTATLLDGVKDFRFVGLMDKDPANVGKEAFGLPIVDMDTAEKNADMIIINTAETYWEIIYKRIQGMKIPIYYKNGSRATKKKEKRFINPYKDLSLEELRLQVEQADYVSFDFFDTLFMRSVCNPRDIFLLIEAKLKGERSLNIGFAALRNQAKSALCENYSLDELYSRLREISGMSGVLTEEIRKWETETERKLLVPRQEVIASLKLALESGKEVYIVSDMYLPEEFYLESLEQCGIHLSAGHILVSNRLNKSKADGTLWRYYRERFIGDKKAVHIGDNRRADIEEPAKYGIESYCAPCPWDLLAASSMNEVCAHMCSVYASALVGCILREKFRNPYVFAHSEGIVEIESNYEAGYCVFGPVILTFLLWLLDRSRRDGIDKLVFMARDGYFLKEDFEYLCELMGEKRACCYLGISRQLAMAASIESEQELMEYAGMPYTGSGEELLADRFGILDAAGGSGRPLEELIKEYAPEIRKRLSRLRRNYLRYIENLEINNECATVDLGYYGNNQMYLNKLTKGQMGGYYFNANLSPQNKNTERFKMTACFQKEDDLMGAGSSVLKKQIFLESFLTAPYGMVKAVDEEGNFICAEKRKNQEHFSDKIEINQGVKRFIADYARLFGEYKIDLDVSFADWYFGYCLDGGVRISDAVKGSFFNDNAMMNRIESMVFY